MTEIVENIVGICLGILLIELIIFIGCVLWLEIKEEFWKKGGK